MNITQTRQRSARGVALGLALAMAAAVLPNNVRPATAATTMRVEDDPAADVYWPEATLDDLQDLGYSVPTDPGTDMGRVHAIEYDADTGVFTGVADPRREGRAAGP